MAKRQAKRHFSLEQKIQILEAVENRPTSETLHDCCARLGVAQSLVYGWQKLHARQELCSSFSSVEQRKAAEREAAEYYGRKVRPVVDKRTQAVPPHQRRTVPEQVSLAAIDPPAKRTPPPPARVPPAVSGDPTVLAQRVAELTHRLRQALRQRDMLLDLLAEERERR